MSDSRDGEGGLSSVTSISISDFKSAEIRGQYRDRACPCPLGGWGGQPQGLSLQIFAKPGVEFHLAEINVSSTLATLIPKRTIIRNSASKRAMSWREWIGFQLVRLRLPFKHNGRPVHINQAISSATSLLACLPEKEDELILAAETAHHLAMDLGIIKVVFIVHKKDMAALVERFSKRAIIVYSKKDIGFFSLPKKSLVRRITGRRIDIAIDLNRKFRLLTAFLCVLSGAQVRIGFRARGSSFFFNFEYEQKDAYKPAFQVYRDLAQVIGLIRSVEEIQEERAG